MPDLLCTGEAGCDAEDHMMCCPTLADRVTERTVERDAGGAERQVWERRIPGTDVPLTRVHLEVDGEGRVRLHEALVAQLLHDAGWERTA